MTKIVLPDSNPKTALGQAKLRLSDTPTESIRQMAKVHSMGAAKYGAFNWREHNVTCTVYYDAAMRHLMAWADGEDYDPESGLPHEAHVMACMSIMIDAKHHGSLNDNRAKVPPMRAPTAADLQSRALRDPVNRVYGKIRDNIVKDT